MIGAMIAVRDGTHFDVDVLPHSASPRVELAARLFVNAAILILGLAFLRWGYDFGVLGSRQQSEIFGLPMLSIYIAWPLAGATWVLFILERSWDDLAAYRKAA
jgi:TRAP-type C4-dicarboxylate transport system permease small subunit